MSSQFSPNLIDQSSSRILTTYAKARLILHDDWSVRLGENRPDRALKLLAATLSVTGAFHILSLEHFIFCHWSISYSVTGAFHILSLEHFIFCHWSISYSVTGAFHILSLEHFIFCHWSISYSVTGLSMRAFLLASFCLGTKAN